MTLAPDNKVPGYRAALLREETKQRLQSFGKSLPDTGFLCERRVVTAAVEVALEACAERPEYLERLIERIPDIAQRDQDGLRTAPRTPEKTQDPRPKTPPSKSLKESTP